MVLRYEILMNFTSNLKKKTTKMLYRFGKLRVNEKKQGGTENPSFR